MKRVICFFTAMLLCMNGIPICADEGVSDTIECSSQEKEAITEVINQDSYYIEHSYLYDTNSKMKKLLETDYGEVFTIVYSQKDSNQNKYGYLLYILSSDFRIIECIKSSYNEGIFNVESEVTGERETFVNDAVYARSSDCRTWTCTKYDSYPGSFSAVCAGSMGTACAMVATVTKLGGLVCAAGIVVACYAPPYKICNTGMWRPVCKY